MNKKGQPHASGDISWCRHRGLLKVSGSHRAPLKQGLLTRDATVVERKKVGLKKARKALQFSNIERIFPSFAVGVSA
ncbi:hypothetical protein BVRB_1g015370 [Beta vulgaris subsp. vulgaris]|nr:hypothetical protein BVRB_1g015370 [Beta vulgaris subsp. vulgaris]